MGWGVALTINLIHQRIYREQARLPRITIRRGTGFSRESGIFDDPFWMAGLALSRLKPVALHQCVLWEQSLLAMSDGTVFSPDTKPDAPRGPDDVLPDTSPREHVRSYRFFDDYGRYR
jgi:hypothetical protein